MRAPGDTVDLRPVYAEDLKTFTIGESVFLAAAYHTDGSSNSVYSYVYRWNPFGSVRISDGSQAVGSGFEAFQLFRTNGCTDVDVLTVPSEQSAFLAFANFMDPGSKSVSVYKWVLCHRCMILRLCIFSCYVPAEMSILCVYVPTCRQYVRTHRCMHTEWYVPQIRSGRLQRVLRLHCGKIQQSSRHSRCSELGGSWRGPVLAARHRCVCLQ
jgi:hypothetical protein